MVAFIFQYSTYDKFNILTYRLTDNVSEDMERSFLISDTHFLTTVLTIRMRGSSLLLLLVLQLSCSKKFLVDPERNRIIDGFGRERIFHGENVVMKTTPFVPITTHFDARYY